MKEKSFLMCIFLMFMPVLNLFSQNVERITYLDLGPTGSQRVTKTVNAVFVGWGQTEVRREGNFMATYRAVRFVNTKSTDFSVGEWSDFELVERRPMRGTLSQFYDGLLRDYTLFPNAGEIINAKGGRVLSMFDIPLGNSTPFGWNRDGNSFWYISKFYIIDVD